MEFSSILYLSFWAIISLVSTFTVLTASKDVNLQIPKSIRSIFLTDDDIDFGAYFTAYLSFLAYFYGFFVRPLQEPDLTRGDVLFELRLFFANHILTILPLACFFIFFEELLHSSTVLEKVFCSVSMLLVVTGCFHFLSLRYMKSKEMGNLLIGVGGPFLVYPSHTLCLALFTALLFSVAFFGYCQGLCEGDNFDRVAKSFGSSIFAIVIAGFVVFLTKFCKWLSQIVSRLLGKYKGIINLIGALIGLLGYVVSQYCLKEKSVSLLVMLISSAFHLLAACAMLQDCNDCGILNFCVGAIVDCAVSLFGLGKFTWTAFAGCAILIFSKSILNYVELRYPRARTSTMSNWLSLEKQIDKDRHSFRKACVAKFIKVFGAKRMEEGRKDKLSTLFIDLYSCVAKLSIEKMAGKEEESKDKLIDKLLNFTLHLLKQNEEIIAEGEEVSRDELIHTLCHLYLRLRNVDEERREDETRNCKIVLCSYQVLRQLQKKEEGNDEEKAKQVRIIRLCRLILVELCWKMGKKRKRRKNIKKVKEEIGFDLPGLTPGSVL